MFQNQVYPKQARAVIGTKASTNPTESVTAGQGAITAGAGGLLVAAFAWVHGNGVATNSNLTGAVKPDGFLANELQAQVTAYMGESTLLVPEGEPVTLFRRGDFFVQTPKQANKGQSVYASLLTGRVLPADAGSFPTDSFGTAGAITAGTTLGSNTVTISAVSSGVVAAGQKIELPGLPENTYIYGLGTSTGGAGTVYVTQKATATATGVDGTITPLDSEGGATGTASFATNQMTVTVLATGQFAPGQLVDSAGVAAGTYIVDQVSGTPGGAGVYTLSTSPGTIAAQAVSASAWVDTGWEFLENGNTGDLLKIGRV